MKINHHAIFAVHVQNATSILTKNKRLDPFLLLKRSVYTQQKLPKPFSVWLLWIVLFSRMTNYLLSDYK